MTFSGHYAAYGREKMSSKMGKLYIWFIAGMIVTMLVLLSAPVYASEYRNRPVEQRTKVVTGDVDQRVKTGDVNTGDVTNTNENQNIANSQTTVNVSGDVIPADTTHIETQDIKLKNTPDNVMVTPGSGDACKAHVGANLSIPGLGAGLTIPLPGKECRKLIYYDRLMEIGRYEAAAKLFCDLKEVFATFGKDEAICEAAVLYVVPKPPLPPTSDNNKPPSGRLMADVTQEEYEQQHEMVEQRYEQQQEVIETQETELKALEARVEKALIERDKRDKAREESEAKFQAIVAGKDYD